jgi:hypothetical protein
MLFLGLWFPKGTAGWRMLRVIRPEAGEDHQVFDRTRKRSSTYTFEELWRVLLILVVLINHSDPATGHPHNVIMTYYL